MAKLIDKFVLDYLNIVLATLNSILFILNSAPALRSSGFLFRRR